MRLLTLGKSRDLILSLSLNFSLTPFSQNESLCLLHSSCSLVDRVGGRGSKERPAMAGSEAAAAAAIAAACCRCRRWCRGSAVRTLQDSSHFRSLRWITRSWIVSSSQERFIAISRRTTTISFHLILFPISAGDIFSSRWRERKARSGRDRRASAEYIYVHLQQLQWQPGAAAGAAAAAAAAGAAAAVAGSSSMGSSSMGAAAGAAAKACPLRDLFVSLSSTLIHRLPQHSLDGRVSDSIAAGMMAARRSRSLRPLAVASPACHSAARPRRPTLNTISSSGQSEIEFRQWPTVSEVDNEYLCRMMATASAA